MVRPKKHGLTYFPFDVDFFDDEKIFTIEAMHKDTGGLTVVKLLARIYRDGFLMFWDDRQAIRFSRKNNIALDKLNQIIEDCVAEGIFNKKLYNDQKILTSRGIQTRFFLAAKRRDEIQVRKDHFLADIGKCKNVVIVDINPSYCNINPPLTGQDVTLTLVNDVSSTQRERESKEKVKNKKTLANSKNGIALAFTEFWELYPKHPNKSRKKACLSKYESKVFKWTPELQIDIIAGLNRWITSESWKKGFMHAPHKFLHEEMWKEHPEQYKPENKRGGMDAYPED